jgi:hypothetical protein
MKKNVKILGLLMIAIMLGNPAIGAPYLYANMTGGAMGGGIGFDLADGRAIDFSVSSLHSCSNSSHSYYCDYYIGNWGIAATINRPASNSELNYDLGLQYALEQAINEKISLGISVNIIDYITAPGADPRWAICGCFAPYLKLLF